MAGKSLSSESDWIAASEALEHLYWHHGGWVGTKFLLAELLKDGKLQARAARLWTSDAPSIDLAWKSRGDAEAKENVEVAPSVWRRSQYWLEDVINWRWPDNRFLLTRTKKPAERTFVEGVTFRTAQVAELLPAKSRKGIGGRSIRAPDWEKIGVALVTMAHQGVFRPPISEGRTEAGLRTKPSSSTKSLLLLVVSTIAPTRSRYSVQSTVASIRKLGS